jgi:hypothetical protein
VDEAKLWAPSVPELLSKLKLTMSASRPASVSTRRRPPPTMIGGCGRCTGLGSPSKPTARTPLAPSTFASPPVMVALTTEITSARRSTRVAGASSGTPIASYSPASHPAPRPISRRPSLNTSIVAISLASTTGLR